MLDTCFLHIPGIGPSFAAKLRQAGICQWDDALSHALPCGRSRAEKVRAAVRESIMRLAAQDAHWFSNAHSPAQQWRLFPHFRHSVAYVDIETTGLSWPEDCITTIALYDGVNVRTYVQGKNLESFAEDIQAYKLLVTWNGRGFDGPILRRELQIPLDKGAMGHLDLLPVYRALGLTGGVEKGGKLTGT